LATAPVAGRAQFINVGGSAGRQAVNDQNLAGSERDDFAIAAAAEERSDSLLRST
jgi:hypothetical protein